MHLLQLPDHIIRLREIILQLRVIWYVRQISIRRCIASQTLPGVAHGDCALYICWAPPRVCIDIKGMTACTTEPRLARSVLN